MSEFRPYLQKRSSRPLKGLRTVLCLWEARDFSRVRLHRELKKGKFFKKIVNKKLEEGDEKAQYYSKRTLKTSGEYLKLIEQIQKANLKIRKNKRKKVPDNIYKGINNNIIYKYQEADSLVYRKDINNIFDNMDIPDNVRKLLALRLSKMFYVANKKFRTKNIFFGNFINFH